MNTEPPTTPRTSVPRHFIAGMVCGFLALFAILIAVAYYWLVGTGWFPEPPRGLTPIWAMVIVLPALVPIGLWCADVAARPILDRLDRQEERFDQLEAKVQSALDRFGGEAMEAARNAGKWEGFTTSLRDTGETGELRQLHPRRSG